MGDRNHFVYYTLKSLYLGSLAEEIVLNYSFLTHDERFLLYLLVNHKLTGDLFPVYIQYHSSIKNLLLHSYWLKQSMIDYYFSFYRMYLKFEYEAKGLNEPVYFPGQLLPEYVAYEFPLHSVHMSLSYVFFLNLIFLSSVYVSSPLEARQYDPYLGG